MKFDSCICGDRNGYTCDSLLTVSTKAEVENQTSPLQQHFIGWFIKAKNPFLHRNRPFMDFSVEQKVIPALCNVLPTSKLKRY
jgi:hypothetical protein